MIDVIGQLQNTLTFEFQGRNLPFFHDEIIGLSQRLTQDEQFNIYPCTMLLLPFLEVINQSVTNIDVQLLAVARSDKNYTSEKRRENIFIPVLFPLIDEIIQRFSENDMRPKYSIIQRYRVDSALNERGNIINAMLDGIELKVNLQIKKICYD